METETFYQNLMLISSIETHQMTDTLKINLVFTELKKEIEYIKEGRLQTIFQILTSYLKLTMLTTLNPTCQTIEMFEYKSFLLETCQKILFWQKNTVFLEKEMHRKEKIEDYTNLCFLYTILTFISWSKQTRFLKFNEKTAYINSFLKGYTFTSNRDLEMDKEYDEEIKSGILEYKKQRKEERKL